MKQASKIDSVILILSSISIGALTLPSFWGALLFVLILSVILLLQNRLLSYPISIKDSIPKTIKESAFPLVTAIILMLYFIINCFRRFEDINMISVILIGLLLSVMSFFGLCVITNYPFKTNTSLINEQDSINNSNSCISYLISAIAASLTIGLLSQSSPLYPINNWSDANCFLTVGRSIIRGVVPYRDLFEHKGPLLYFIHALCSLIPGKAFFGVFIFQTILAFATHRILLRLSSLFTKTDYLYEVLTAPLFMLIYSCNAYYAGDSVEEIMLPFFLYGIYVLLNSLKYNSDISMKQSFFIGIGAATAFWIKYNLCGFYIGFILIMIVSSIHKRKLLTLFSQSLYFLLACVIVSMPILIYFVFNNALSDLFTVYFYNNIFLYQSLEGGIPITAKMPYAMMLLFMKLDSNYFMTLFITISVLFLATKPNSKYLSSVVTLFIFTFVFIFWGDSQMFYYVFGVASFAVFGLIPVTIMIRKIISMRKAVAQVLITSAIILSLTFIAYSSSFSTNMIFRKRMELPQFIFAEIVPDNATMLCYGFPDLGFYTAADLIPSEKYFCTYMIDDVLKESIIQRDTAVADGRVEYIVTDSIHNEWNNYELIQQAPITYSDFNGVEGTDVFYLYKLIK